MGISLVAMTVFLYPVLIKASKELALGMVAFPRGTRGCLLLYFDPHFLTLVAVGNNYIATGADSAVLQSIGSLLYQSHPSQLRQFHHFSHRGNLYIHRFCPHPVDPPLVVCLGLHRRGRYQWLPPF